MLRTTVSRIKKVCVVAFVPRLLRGDQRCTASKFEIFSSAVLKKAQKSTKTTDEDDEGEKSEKKDGSQYKMVSEQESKLQKNRNRSEELNSAEEVLDEGFPPIETSTPVPLRETPCQKCQRIIDQAFGKDDNLSEPVLGEQYFSHGVNIEDTRQEIENAEIAKLKFISEKNLDKPVPDDRVQFGVYQSRELSENPVINSDDLMMNESMLKMSANIGDINRNIEPLEDLKQEATNIHLITAQGNFCDLSEKSDCIRQIESFELKYSARKTDTEYMLDAVVAKTTNNDLEQETLPLNEILAEEEKFIRELEMKEETSFGDTQPMQPMQHVQHMQNMQHMHHHMQPMQHRQHIQHMRHMEQMQHLLQQAPPDKLNAGQTSNARLDCYGMHEQKEQEYHNASHQSVEGYVHNEQQFEKNINYNIRNFGDTKILNATTASENEEQLAQKIENIDETPLVEAHKPKLEGFNVTPRILGETEAKVNCTCDKNVEDQQLQASPKVDVPGSFDEVAKRCLDTPAGNIDEILLREMEKLGIPITSKRPSQGRPQLLDDELVQMDVLKKQRKNPTDAKDLDLESHECEKGAIELCSAQMMYPSRFMCNEKVLPALEETDEDVGLHPNQVLIDPYDKKTIAYDTGEYDASSNYDPNKKFSYYYVPHTNMAEAEPTEASGNHPLDSSIDDVKAPMDKLKMAKTNNVQKAKQEQMTYAKKDDKISSFNPPKLSILHNMVNSKRQSPSAYIFSAQDTYATRMNSKKVSDLDNLQNTEKLDPHPEIQRSQNVYSSKLDRAISYNPYTRTESDTTTEELEHHPEIQHSQNAYASKLAQKSVFNPFKISESDNTRNPEQLDPHPGIIQRSHNAYTSKLDRTISFNPYTKTESDVTDKLDPHPEIQRSHNDYNTNIDERQSEPRRVRASDNIQDEEVETYSEKQQSQNVYTTEQQSVHPPLRAFDNLYEEDYREIQQPHNVYATELEELSSSNPHIDNISGSGHMQNEEQLDPRSEMEYNRFVNSTGIGKSAPVNPLKVSQLYDILDNEPLERHPEINRTMYIYAVGMDKTSSLDPYNVNASCCTWGEGKLDPHPEINHMLYLHETGLEHAYLYGPSYLRSSPYTNTNEQTEENKNLDHKNKTVFATKTSEPVSFNKPTMTVSDEVWDKYLDFETPTKQDKKAARVNVSNDLWNDDQLDPHYVLTCNETCPISPKPQVCACETGRFADAEAIFDREFTKSESEAMGLMDYSTLLTDLERGSHNDEVKRSSSNRLNIRKVSNLFKSAASGGSASMSTSINAMPKLNEDVKLSELLRRVRERSRILECKNELKALGVEVDPVQAKCGRKAPRCPPTAPRPPANPLPPPSFGLPPLKPRPRACKPKRKPTNKCSSCDMDVLPGLLLRPMMKAQTPVTCTEMVCEMNDVGTAGVLASTKSAADLTDEVIDRLQSLGKMLGGVLRKGKTEILEAGCVMKSHRLCKILLARDYEPWAPIPSWPTPKKDDAKKPECASPGCKLFPPPRVCEDPPCEQKPCTGFPRRTFSLLDCFAVSLGENKVYDLGDF